ncbi:LCP family protein [Desmospora activa]|uniref:LytR family transcriptional attenuator n=1 Tax=Desmospora activa DSM 45169 TaxID=1121389 RepID=A0A2T4ZCD1_9BACL|nr:LCP family protein [Desmospora activa]PTM59545.1 LytR family transcriptional attenuator [Desmospora activa DSM 45169]
MSRVQKHKKKKPWLRVLLICFTIILIGSGCIVYQLWGAFDQSFDPLERDKSTKREQVATMDEPFTVLLIGADGDDQNWRADTLMLAAINPKENTMFMYSIPRDSYAEMANSNGVKTKINAAPYYGVRAGVDPETNLVETVEDYLNVPVDYFVKLNFQGFIDVVDAIGGVEVDVPFSFDMRLFNKWYSFQEGPAHLDGHEALAYVRMRKSDPRGDAGRNDRQREVVQNLLSQGVSFNSVNKINDVLQAVGNNLGHNMQVNEMYKMQSLYRNVPKDQVETLQDNGYDSKDNPQGIWYHYISDEERLRLSHILQRQLDLPLQTLDGQEFMGQSPADQGENTPAENEGSPQLEVAPEEGNIDNQTTP